MNEPKQPISDTIGPHYGEADFKGFDPDLLDRQEKYKLLTGAVIPRPIALVSSLGRNGPNAAPFSFFNGVCDVPPMIMFSSIHDYKDTIGNIKETGEFVVHIVDYGLREMMNICATEYSADVNEIEEAGFRTAPSKKVRVPRLIDCPCQIECKLNQIVELGKNPCQMVIGEVVYFHFRQDIVNDNFYVDPVRLNPLGRLSGPAYSRMVETFDMPRIPPPAGKERKTP